MSLKHQHRPDLAGEHPRGDLGQIIFFFVFTALWVMDSFLFHASASLGWRVSWIVRIPLALALLVLIVRLMRDGHRLVLWTVHDKPRVVQEGVFGRVRHPIYLSVLLTYLAMMVATASVVSLPLWALIFVFYNSIASYEEKLLLARFGQAYETYARRVPRWIPRWKR